jgi:hypothetical protein
MGTINYAIAITTTSLSSEEIESTLLQVSATSRIDAITKLFDLYLRHSFDIEELLQDNNTIVITLKENHHE